MASTITNVTGPVLGDQPHRGRPSRPPRPRRWRWQLGGRSWTWTPGTRSRTSWPHPGSSTGSTAVCTRSAPPEPARPGATCSPAGSRCAGACGVRLVASMKRLKNGTGKAFYLCHSKVGGSGCIGILAEDTGRTWSSGCWPSWTSRSSSTALAADDQAERRDEITTALRAIDGQRNDLARMWSKREITAPEWQTARAGLAEQEQQLRRDLAAVPPSLSRVGPGTDPRGLGRHDPRRAARGPCPCSSRR